MTEALVRKDRERSTRVRHLQHVLSSIAPHLAEDRAHVFERGFDDAVCYIICLFFSLSRLLF
jgi:hypothetical protein